MLEGSNIETCVVTEVLSKISKNPQQTSKNALGLLSSIWLFGLFPISEAKYQLNYYILEYDVHSLKW